jgi:cytochrome b subunit of formate dehydrogenase
VVGAFCLAQSPGSHSTKAKDGKDTDTTFAKKECLECHKDAAREDVKPVNGDALAVSAHKDMDCQDCHTTMTAVPHTPSMEHDKPSCAGCHDDEATAFAASAHAKPDKVKGDHPTCATCHGGGDPHAIHPIAYFTRPVKAELCSQCHRDRARMRRYGVDPDAVASYEESFHGKALLRFHASNVAVCTDCHTTHSMLPPSNPKAPTNRLNAGHLCSQKGCHNGAGANFAMSGANHLRLKIKSDPILKGTDLFFRILVIFMVSFLFLGVILDLRLKVFGKGTPRCGKAAGLLVSISFLFGSASLAAGLFHEGILAAACIVLAFALLMLAYLAYFLWSPKALTPTEPQKTYPRFSLSQRIQHVLLMLCFTVLIATGFPLHFYAVSWLQSLYAFIGGMHAAREIHRIAAAGLICVWIYHLVELLVRWARAGFSRSALTMVPTRQDVLDFIQQTKVYLGLSDKEPEWGRFQVRQKLDYLAEYWGIPVMVVSGIIMWFPIYWGNHLPEEALSIAIVAHGWEATLAFLAIILWHLNHEIFNPDAFPMRKVWITGVLSAEEMAIDHPKELKRLEGNG